MNVCVLKFGGVAVRTPESRDQVAEIIIDHLRQGKKVVVVVSAIGRKGDPYATDSLLDFVESEHTTQRERDLVSFCGEVISGIKMATLLKEKGYPAEALTGPQAGIVTNGEYFDADVLSVDPSRIRQLLSQGKIVVVAGHQGRGVEAEEICTLGRGGSDITAIALGAALNLRDVLIYTNVDGILSADPLLISNAEKYERLSYAEAWELAVNGAKVINPRAVAMAQKYGVEIHIKNVFSNDEGTIICHGEDRECMTAPGVVHKGDMILITLEYGPEQDVQQLQGLMMESQIFEALSVREDLQQLVVATSTATVNQALELLTEWGQISKIEGEYSKVSVAGFLNEEMIGRLNGKVKSVVVEQDLIMPEVSLYKSISYFIKRDYLIHVMAMLHDELKGKRVDGARFG